MNMADHYRRFAEAIVEQIRRGKVPRRKPRAAAPSPLASVSQDEGGLRGPLAGGPAVRSSDDDDPGLPPAA